MKKTINLIIGSFFSISASLAIGADEALLKECQHLKPDWNSANISMQQLKAYTDCTNKAKAKQFLSKALNYQYQNDAQTEAFLTNLSVAYFSALRQCKPGKYVFVFSQQLITATIEGFRNNICHVSTSSQQAIDLVKDNKRIVSKSECEYDRESLGVFTDEAAKTMGAFMKETQRAILKNPEMIRAYQTSIDAFGKHCKQTYFYDPSKTT